MMKTKKNFLQEIEDFIDKNAIEYDDVSITIEIENVNLLNISSIKSDRFHGKLKC